MMMMIIICPDLRRRPICSLHSTIFEVGNHHHHHHHHCRSKLYCHTHLPRDFVTSFVCSQNSVTLLNKYSSFCNSPVHNDHKIVFKSILGSVLINAYVCVNEISKRWLMYSYKLPLCKHVTFKGSWLRGRVLMK